MTLAPDRVMCSAIPTVARHGWRTDVGCASSANAVIEYRGTEHQVCKMHEAKWDRISEKRPDDEPGERLQRRADMAREWGW